jgi:uncharacterized protein YxjI
MPLLRGRRDEANMTRYRMQEKLFAIGDDFWIENEAGQRAFKVNGKVLRVRYTLVLETPNGEELFSVQSKMLHIRDTMNIEQSGRKVASIKKALVSPLRDRFSIDVEDGEDMEAKGNIVDHEYKIERDGDQVAEVSRRWFRVRDTYGVEIAPGEDDALVLAVVICIDQMTHDVG